MQAWGWRATWIKLCKTLNIRSDNQSSQLLAVRELWTPIFLLSFSLTNSRCSMKNLNVCNSAVNRGYTQTGISTLTDINDTARCDELKSARLRRFQPTVWCRKTARLCRTGKKKRKETKPSQSGPVAVHQQNWIAWNTSHPLLVGRQALPGKLKYLYLRLGRKWRKRMRAFLIRPKRIKFSRRVAHNKE